MACMFTHAQSIGVCWTFCARTRKTGHIHLLANYCAIVHCYVCMWLLVRGRKRKRKRRRERERERKRGRHPSSCCSCCLSFTWITVTHRYIPLMLPVLSSLRSLDRSCLTWNPLACKPTANGNLSLSLFLSFLAFQFGLFSSSVFSISMVRPPYLTSSKNNKRQISVCPCVNRMRIVKKKDCTLK